MAKLILEIDEDYPFFILGISARAANYRLCWNMNKTLDIMLRRQPDIALTAQSALVQEHSYYSFQDDILGVNYHLIENKSGNRRFMNELPQADFLLVTNETDSIDMDSLAMKIRSIVCVIIIIGEPISKRFKRLLKVNELLDEV